MADRLRKSQGLVLGAIVCVVVGYLALKGSTSVTLDLSKVSFQLDGKPKKLLDYHGKVVLLNFWAYWCEPCLVEMPSLRKLEDRFKGRDFILLALHSTAIDSKDQLEFKARNELPKNLIFDVDLNSLDELPIEGLPFTILLDKTGKIRKSFEGARDWDAKSVIEQIEELLS